MDQTLVAALTEQFRSAISAAFPDLDSIEEELEVAATASEAFGHYQCNAAMKLAKRVSQKPRDIATKIIDQLDRKDLAQVEIAGPGFINVRFTPEFLSDWVEQVYRDPRLGVPPLEASRRVIVEFSSPNTAKEMHVGHLRSTIIGDCLARVLEFLGYDVLRLNHVGDWGTQFGMLIAYMRLAAPDVLQGTRDADLTQLVSWYKAAKVQFDEDPAFKKAAQMEVVALQGGNPISFKAWEKICAISRAAYQQIYDLLDVRLIERGESTYNPMLPRVISDLEAKGLITLSEGAKCVYLEGFRNREGDPLPLIVQKSDGGYLYATTDLAALRQRISEERADWIIYVTDAGQATHFAMVFAAGEKVGYVDRSKVRIDHVPFGLVLGPDGKKFRTRAGETERLMDLLMAAVDKARLILQEREVQLSKEELERTARALGLGAVKYADLSCNRTKDYTFSYDRMLRFEGNTAAFLLYSYVRTVGIKRKVQVDVCELEKSERITLKHPTEVSLGLHLCRFAETLESLTRDLLPNRLTDYLYGLAEQFNAFFRDCRVEGSKEQGSRLLLCEATAKVMAQGLHLLGLTTVERM